MEKRVVKTIKLRRVAKSDDDYYNVVLEYIKYPPNSYYKKLNGWVMKIVGTPETFSYYLEDLLGVGSTKDPVDLSDKKRTFTTKTTTFDWTCDNINHLLIEAMRVVCRQEPW